MLKVTPNPSSAIINLKRVNYFTKIKNTLALLVISTLLISSNLFSQSAVSPGTAPVTPPTTGFGIDGNLKANVPTAGIGDWLPNTSASGGVLNGLGEPLVPTTTYHSQDLFSSGDNIFVGGLKKDGDLTKYTWKNGSPSPAKCDINHLLVHIAEDPEGDTWITLAGDRQAVNGNSFISIALLQKMLTANSNKTFTSGAPSSTGGRTVGDVQISAEFTGGGVNPNLYLEEWKLVGGKYQWVTFSINPIPAFGSTNASVITGLPYTAFGTTSYDINAFIEVSFNISAIYRNTSTPCVGSIASMFVMTKSSQSVTADLADFVDPLQINLDINSPKPTAADATYCVGQPIQNLTATGEAGATFKWYTSVNVNGEPTGTPTSGASYSPSINNNAAGTYNYYVTQSLKGCEGDPTKVTVTVNPNATASAGTAPAPQCYVASGNTFNLSGSGTNGTPLWTVKSKSNNSLNAEITGANILTPSVKVTGGSGTVTLTLTVTSGFTPSCGTPSSDVTVTVNPNATASAGTAPPAQCYDATNGNTFSLSGSGTNGNPVWTVQSKSSNSLVAEITGGTTFTPTVKVTGGSGTVTLRLTVNSTTSCGNPTSDVTVTVNPLPTANAGTNPDAQCFVATGNTFNLNGTGTNGSILWSVAPNGNPNNATVEITNGTTLSPTVKVTSATGGATVTLRLTVTSNASPACGNKTDDVELVVSPQVSGPGVTYVGPGCTETTFKVEIRTPQAGTYILKQTAGGVGPITKVFPADAVDGIIVFEGLTIGKGYSVTLTVGNCTSAASSCGDFSTSNQVTQTTSRQSARSESETIQEIVLVPRPDVTAAPNPFSTRVKFSLKSLVSGHGTLELFNLLGQKVQTVFDGYVEAGRVKNIDYNAPGTQSANLIYVFRVGDQKVTGKLIRLGK